MPIRPKGHAGSLLKELDAPPIVQRDDFSLVFLLQSLQSAEEQGFFQPMELWGEDKTDGQEKHPSPTKENNPLQWPLQQPTWEATLNLSRGQMQSCLPKYCSCRVQALHGILEGQFYTLRIAASLSEIKPVSGP